MNGIENILKQKMDAYRGNPQKLMQSYQQNQDLMDLLALQKLKSEKEAAQRQMAMQAQQNPQTVKEQREKELLALTKNEMAQQVGSALNQQQRQQQQNLQRVMQSGIPTAPAPNMARMAGGGIVGFNEGGMADGPVQGDPGLADKIGGGVMSALQFADRGMRYIPRQILALPDTIKSLAGAEARLQALKSQRAAAASEGNDEAVAQLDREIASLESAMRQEQPARPSTPRPEQPAQTPASQQEQTPASQQSQGNFNVVDDMLNRSQAEQDAPASSPQEPPSVPARAVDLLNEIPKTALGEQIESSLDQQINIDPKAKRDETYNYLDKPEERAQRESTLAKIQELQRRNPRDQRLRRIAAAMMGAGGSGIGGLFGGMGRSYLSESDRQQQQEIAQLKDIQKLRDEGAQVDRENRGVALTAQQSAEETRRRATGNLVNFINGQKSLLNSLIDAESAKDTAKADMAVEQMKAEAKARADALKQTVDTATAIADLVKAKQEVLATLQPSSYLNLTPDEQGVLQKRYDEVSRIYDDQIGRLEALRYDGFNAFN